MPLLLMVGISHQLASVEVRERVALQEHTWRAHAPAHIPTLLLSTCNRLEVYAWVDGRSQAAVRSLTRSIAAAASLPVTELEPYLVTRGGQAALLHLVRVTSGLDSLVVGEEQIRGQVREALRLAEGSQSLPGAFRGIFQRAIESARRVRGSGRLGKVPSSATAGVNVASRALPEDLDGALAVVLGAGVVAKAAAEALLARGACVRMLNRTPAHVERVMAHVRGRIEIGSLTALPEALAEAALLVGATASRTPVVTFDMAAEALRARGGRPLVVLDVALPRDVDPQVRTLGGVTLIDLDDLERLCPVDVSTRQAERQEAEALALAEAERLQDWLRTRDVSPAIAELRRFAESIRAGELRRSASRLRDLTPEQAAAVEALTSRIVNKLMHGPTLALRDAAKRPGTLGRSRTRILKLLRASRRRTA